MDINDPKRSTWRVGLHLITDIGLLVVALGCLWAEKYGSAIFLIVWVVGSQIVDAIETGFGDLKRQQSHSYVASARRFR